MTHSRGLRIMGLGAALSALVIITACSSPSGQASASGSSSCALVGMTDRDIANNAWEATLVQSIQSAGKNAGVCVQAVDAQGNVATQVSQINTFIDENAKAVILEPVDDTGDAPAIAALKKAGIPFIVVTDLVANNLADEAYCNIHANEYAAAGLVGYDLAAAAAKKYHAGETITLWVNAIFPHEILTETRENGFMSGWNRYWSTHPGGPKTVRLPDQYGQASPDIDLPIVRNVLTANPGLAVMFDETDLTYVSVLSSLKQLNLIKNGVSQVLIGGFDGQTSVLQQMVQDPNFGMVADGVNEPPVQGAWAIEEAVAAIHHLPAVDCGGTPATREVPVIAVTTSDAKTFYNPAYHNGYDPALVQAAYAETKKLES
jgi:ribose transport system substrate-binding protein